MPHPKLRHLQIGFDNSNNLEEAIDDYRQANQPATFDLLRFRGTPLITAAPITTRGGGKV